jgi:hypothetical protein
MEWKLIEKKWHEMALRLQAVSPTQRHAQTKADAGDGPVAPPVKAPAMVPKIETSDVRAMA